jgi:hypothetical protein
LAARSGSNRQAVHDLVLSITALAAVLKTDIKGHAKTVGNGNLMGMPYFQRIAQNFMSILTIMAIY